MNLDVQGTRDAEQPQWLGAAAAETPLPAAADLTGRPPSPARAPFDLGPRLFALGVWLALSVAAAVVVLTLGSNVPYYDDWPLMPVLSAAEPLTADWVLRQENEHRIPVTKLLLYAWWRIAPGDLHGPMLLSVGLVSAAALALMLALWQVRGTASYSDAVLPMLLLHLGHAENFLWAIQLFVCTASVLMLVAIALLVFGLQRRGWTATIGLSAVAILMPLHGAGGLVQLPAILAALGYLAWLAWRGPEAHRGRFWTLAAALAVTLLLIGWYAIGFQRIERHAIPADFAAILHGVLGCAGMALGAAGRLPWHAAGWLVLASGVGTAVMLGVVAWRQPQARHRAIALALLLASTFGLIAVIGAARAAFGAAAFRYALQAAPALVVVYFAWSLFGPPALGRFIRVSLFTAVCALLAGHGYVGLDLAVKRHAAERQLAADIAAGLPPVALAGRHWHEWLNHEATFEQGLRVLRDRGIGQSKRIVPDLAYRVVELPVPPRSVERAGHTWRFAWEPDVRVDAVRVTYAYDAPRRYAALEVCWPRPETDADFDPLERTAWHYRIRGSQDDIRQTTWIDRRLGHLAIRAPLAAAETPGDVVEFCRNQPDAAAKLTIKRVELLVREP